MDALSRRKAWSKPTLAPHGAGANNIFGMGRPGTNQRSIDGVPIEGIVAQYGSPVFVISEARLRANVRDLLRAFRTRYPRVRYGWSYKTNYLNAVCSILHQEGAWAEVVSDFEYEKARNLGVPGSHIIFNGPYKPRAALERAVEEGALIHLDNLDELYLLESIGKEMKRTIPCALRLNFSTGFTEPWSRFGFNVETGAAHDAVRRMAAAGVLQLIGLHSHIGTFILDPRAYTAQVRVMLDFMAFAEAEGQARIDYLDIGGGFASRNALQGVYLPPEQVVPTFDQYAAAIAEPLLAVVGKRKTPPMLVLETGRAVVDDAESLVTTVVGSKRLPDGRNSMILDAGVNVLFTSYWYHHGCHPVRSIAGDLEETVLYGPLCMNIDVMRHSVWLPPMRVGDQLVFNPVGAYNNTQWQEFIQYRPAIVLVQESGEVSVVRQRDNLQSMMAQEKLPASLVTPFPNALPE
jgi:diaminopimelate decarboxylase